MKFQLPILILILSACAQAQDSVISSELSNLNRMVGQSVLDDYLKDKSEEGLPGGAIKAILPFGKDLNACPEDEEPPKVRYEVVFIAQGSTQKGMLQNLPDQTPFFSPNYLQAYLKNPNQKMDVNSLDEAVKTNWATFNGSSVDKNEMKNQQIFIETLFQGVRNATVDDNALARQIGELINRHYHTDEEKMNLLSTLSDRLYDQYNDLRNPGHNTKSSNPFNLPIPKGDITLKNLITAVDDNQTNMAGVCNDISEAVGMIGQAILPDKDVLVLNSGTHLGVMVADGKSTHIIDGLSQLTGHNDTVLERTRSSTNLRIAKVVDGKLKEIAVADTQLGQLLEQSFQTGKPLLKTGADINSIIGQFNRSKVRKSKISNLGGAIGYADLNESQVLVVVAKYNASGRKWDRSVGLGFSGQDLKLEDSNKYMVHFRGGAHRKIIHYMSPKVDFKLSSGIQSEIMYTVAGAPPNVLQNGPESSVSLDLVQRMQLSVVPDSKSFIGASLDVRNSLGPSNWGATTGAVSKIDSHSIAPLIENMRFHLNQVNFKGILEKKFSPTATGTLQVTYQGSNIGQNVGVLGGVRVKATQDAEILYFVGHDSRLKGYDTQNSVLVAPEGGRVGVVFQNSKGVRASGAIRNISGNGKPIVEASVVVPLDVTPKRVPAKIQFKENFVETPDPTPKDEPRQ